MNETLKIVPKSCIRILSLILGACVFVFVLFASKNEPKPAHSPVPTPDQSLALARLGLDMAAEYSAPAMITITSARASVSGGSGGQAKKATEKERKGAKKVKEPKQKAAKKVKEPKQEAEKRAAEQEFEAAKKALETSGASEAEKKELERQYESAKKELEGRYKKKKKEIPDTVVGVLRNLFARRTEDEDDSEKSRKSKKRGKPDKLEKSDERKRSKSRKTRRTVDPDITPQLTFKRNEVLAINLSASGLRAARKLGFGVKTSAIISSLRGNLTRLTIPRAVNTPKALRLLKRELPSDAFVLNKVYSVYRAARKSDESQKDTRNTRSERGNNNRRRTAGRASDSCKSDHCFGRSIIGWQEKHTLCSKGIRVGVIDTSVDYKHPTFADHRIKVGKFIPENRIVSSSEHGTGIVALLAGSRESGTPGLIPYSDIYTASIFYADKQGLPVTDTVTLLKALDWMEAWNVDLINMSFTGPKDILLEKAIRRLSTQGIIFVAAAGNDGPTAPPSYPAAYSEVIAVTAVNKKLLSYRHANRGSYIDIAAPGVDVWTAFDGRKEGYQSGTSFAVPHVTASLASVYKNLPQKKRGHDWIEALPIRDLGAKGRDPIYGRGLLLAPQRCGARKTRHEPLASANPRRIFRRSDQRRSNKIRGPEAGLLSLHNTTIQPKNR